MNKKRKIFEKICRDIKNIKIQGARNIAIAGLRAYSLEPTESSKSKILSLRPTEPMLERVLNIYNGYNKEKILGHFNFVQNKINNNVFRLIKNNEVIFTHCHSTNVIKSLIYSRKKGKKFEVYNTETRPLYQGRKTAIKLMRNKIPVTMFIDSAIGTVFSEKKLNKIFLGSDALLNEGIVNKIGSKAIAQIAKDQKIPLYIIADSWKYTEKKISLENRKLNEVWNKAPKNVKIKNPAFEFVHKKYIKKIITEFGVLNYNDFLKTVKKFSGNV